MLTHYEYLDWPSVPENLIQESLSFIQTQPNIFGGATNPVNVNKYELYNAPDILKSWIKSNVPLNFNDSNPFLIRIQKIVANIAEHIDPTRDIAYNFLLVDNNAQTNWHHRDRSIIESTRFNPFRWHRLNSGVLHSVSDYKTPRIAITMQQNVCARPS